MKKDDSRVIGHIGPPTYGGLDPASDPARWEGVVTRIVTAAQPELRRRAARGFALTGALERWGRAGMAAAGVVAAAASIALLMLGTPAVEAEAAVVHPADALLADMADWLVTGEAPTVVALLSEVGERQ